MKLRFHGESDIGRVRSRNEDSFLADGTRQVFAVADGIGGLPGGAQASQAAIASLRDWFGKQAQAPLDYGAAISLVNEQVYSLGRSVSPRHGIGTTLTAGHFDSGHLVVLHVGDSFLFRWRHGQIEALTVEHNVENELRARTGNRPDFIIPENGAALTRCIGQPPPVEGDVHAHDVEVGDRYLICSDGVTRCILDGEIGGILANQPSPEQAARELITIANERGGIDNATAVVIFVEE